MTIVKVQPPLFSTHKNAGCFVHDEERTHMVEQSISLETLNAIGGQLKAYFEAEFDPKLKCWIIGKKVESQPW